MHTGLKTRIENAARTNNPLETTAETVALPQERYPAPLAENRDADEIFS